MYVRGLEERKDTLRVEVIKGRTEQRTRPGLLASTPSRASSSHHQRQLHYARCILATYIYTNDTPLRPTIQGRKTRLHILLTSCLDSCLQLFPLLLGYLNSPRRVQSELQQDIPHQISLLRHVFYPTITCTPDT